MSEKFDRISDIPALEDDEHYAFLAGDKIWLFSQKFHDQPTYHSGQRVAHKGGYSVYYDTKTNKWSEGAAFAPLSTEEHVDEVMFVHEDRICCLLYSHFGKIEFLQLAVFDVNERQFTMWNEFSHTAIKANDEDETFKQHLIIADGVLPDKSRVLVASIEGTLHLFKLSIDFSSKQASIIPASKYSAEIRDSHMLIPIHAAVDNSHVILESSNRAACVVHWQSTTHDRLVVDRENFEKVEIKGDPPKFQFSGARLLALINNSSWLHFGGYTQKGMTGRDFNGELWSLEKAFSDTPEWKKLSGIELPKDAEKAELVFDSKNKLLYVVDLKNGLFSAKIEL